MQQGTKGNINGRLLESTVKNTICQKGFENVKYREWERNQSEYGDELLLENVPYNTIYNHKGNTEFLLKSVKYNLEIRIECKWQQVSGSVDEKLPYLYLNTIESMPENDIIILIDGKGWKPGAIEWLRDAVSQGKYLKEGSIKKNIRVFGITDFITWANRLFV